MAKTVKRGFKLLLNIMSTLSILIFGIIDIYLSILTFYHGVIGLRWFLIIHVILFIIVFLIRRLVLRRLNLSTDYLFLLIPGLGFIIGSSVNILINYLKRESTLIEEYEKYIELLNEVNTEEGPDLEDAVNIMSFSDVLKYSSSEKKKEIIIDMIQENLDVQMKLLREGLQDEDVEVVHYAATTLNLLEQRFEEKIYNLRHEYEENKSEDLLKQLLEAYEEYIYSGLLDEDLKKGISKEYLKSINEAREIIGETYEFLIKALDAKFIIEETEGVNDIFRILYRDYAENWEVSLYLMKYYYRQRNMKEVRNIARKIKVDGIMLPEKEMQFVDYWIERGEA